MNYKQKYNEALERMKSWAKGEHPECFSEAQKAVEFIFPELKESEDERIRKELIELISCMHDADPRKKGWITWLEKQGEKKPFDYENVNIQQKDFAPKTEPKFKVGNWYQCIKDFYGKGVTFDKGTAYYCAKEGCLLDGCHIAIVEDLYDNFKLWTIEDAKDGDVLNSPSHRLIWIYKDNEHYHVCVNMNYVTKNIATDGLIKIPSDACPATKDERTILFEKMKEAGYEWDSEKKELKKIEPKTLNADKVIEWLKTHGNLVPVVTIKINEVIAKFKKDFGL